MQLRRKLVSLAGIPFGLILLCSCSASSAGVTENPAVINQGPVATDGPASATDSTPNPASSQTPATTNKSDISSLKSSLKQSLSSLASSVDYPSANQIKDATKTVASDNQDVEISPVATPTGLRADSIEVAFAIDSKECLFGYIQGKDVSTSVLPLLSNGKCMIGATS